MILRKAFIVLVALAALALASPAQTQPVLKVGSTPNGISNSRISRSLPALWVAMTRRVEVS